MKNILSLMLALFFAITIFASPSSQEGSTQEKPLSSSQMTMSNPDPGAIYYVSLSDIAKQIKDATDQVKAKDAETLSTYKYLVIGLAVLSLLMLSIAFRYPMRNTKQSATISANIDKMIYLSKMSETYKHLYEEIKKGVLDFIEVTDVEHQETEDLKKKNNELNDQLKEFEEKYHGERKIVFLMINKLIGLINDPDLYNIKDLRAELIAELIEIVNVAIQANPQPTEKTETNEQ